MQSLLKIFSSVPQFIKLCLTNFSHSIKLCLSDDKGAISSTRVSMLIIILWFIADWLLEFHSKGIYTLTWEKLTLLTSVFGLKAIQKFPETSKIDQSAVSDQFSKDNDLK